MLVSSVMRVYEPASAADRVPVQLPANLFFPAMFRDLIESMFERSPTFRRQCQRLAQAGRVRVHLKAMFPNNYSTHRAHTDIIRTAGGGLLASVVLRRAEGLAELIAHELEHIIEQIDGVDLLAHAALPGSGVRQCPDGSYETIRAERIGALVAQEARARR